MNAMLGEGNMREEIRKGKNSRKKQKSLYFILAMKQRTATKFPNLFGGKGVGDEYTKDMHCNTP